ncbi:hypothetical protein TCAL_15645, partial [Tigriopus californicus]
TPTDNEEEEEEEDAVIGGSDAPVSCLEPERRRENRQSPCRSIRQSSVAFGTSSTNHSRWRMKIAAILFTLSLFLGWSSTDTLDNSIGIDDSHHCALEMHKAQAFRGRKFSIFGSKVRLRGLQKSLNTIGE